jgi:hypothetical protein
VADRKLGVIDTGKKYLANSDRTWEETVYVCNKHYMKLLSKLGFENKEVQHGNHTWLEEEANTGRGDRSL